MPSPYTLLKQAINLFLANFGYFFKFWLVQLGISLAIILLIVIPFVINGALVATGTWQAWAVALAGIGVIAAVIIFTWLFSAMYVQVKSVLDQSHLPIRQLLGQGWQVTGKAVVTVLLSTLLLVLGLALLVVPGLIFMVWFGFALPILFTENKWGWSALKASRAMVKGKFKQVLWYLSFPTLVVIGIQVIIGLLSSLVPLIAGVLNVLFSIVSIPLGIVTALYLFSVYKQFSLTQSSS